MLRMNRTELKSEKRSQCSFVYSFPKHSEKHTKLSIFSSN